MSAGLPEIIRNPSHPLGATQLHSGPHPQTSQPMYNSRHIANFLIERGLSSQRPITPLQVVQLVYLSHGWMLAVHDRPLILEPVEAWGYGPFISDLYYALKFYGPGPILNRLTTVWNQQFDEQAILIMADTFDKYAHLSGVQLLRLSHVPGTPWDQMKGADHQIPNSLIRTYFRSQLVGYGIS